MGGLGRVVAVVRRALRLYRRNFAKILLVSAIVFAPLSLFSALANAGAEDLLEGSGAAPALGVVALVATALALFGYGLCSGLLDRMVVGPDFGHPRQSLGQALRTLPYVRLVVLDLVTSAGVAIGLALGVVPGLVFFTLVAISPPLLVLERRGVLVSLRRSASLVRHVFWVTFFVVTLPVAIEHQVFAAIELLFDLPILVLFGLHLLASVAVLAVVVLCETTLAFTLVEEERAEMHRDTGRVA